MYAEVPSQLDLPATDAEVLALWEQGDVFARSLEATADAPRWVFYEGPPTANGMPGAHHLEARVFKDVFPRFQTMRGRHVPRRAGWDCHGLPVELAVERELGFTGKGDIEDYGVAAFNARCRDSVERHVGAFEAMTTRMGYWVDMSSAYRTMDASYVESVWWSLKTIFDKGLLVSDHRVAPYCPRCGTGLSDHELAQGYETVVDPSVFVRMAVTAGPLADLGASLLVWTTTPWTLVSNTAVAVHPRVAYVAARTRDGEVLVVAEPLLTTVLGDDATVVARFTGAELERTPYRPALDWVDVPDAHYVVLGDYVTVEDGSGLVHQAPAFGADDLAVCRAYGLPVVNPVDATGHFEPGVPVVAGLFFKKADATIVDQLRASGALFAHQPYEHAYPHCWRCHTPLMYYAQPSWYIRTTQVKDELLAANAATRWHPPTIQWGRYGDWLANNVDWALSRNRYWGTPLPIWRCADGHLTCVGSLAELGVLAGQPLDGLDPHRPYVDDVVLACPHCGQEARRVPEVIDCWYDSGAMPFAQWGYPHSGQGDFERSYPADFICEAIDQTRGWFYTLMAVGTTVFGRSAYTDVVCLGHILDEQGRKMSKHLGNVLDPMALMDTHGADAVRWFMAAAGSPWQSRRVGDAAIGEVVRKVLLTYWNTVAFQSLYARAAEWVPSGADPEPATRPTLDRWALSQAATLANEVAAALEEFDTQRAGRLIADYVDELSNWYVRRSRRRFWAGDAAALATLHEALRTLTLVLAPLCPFVTERVWQLLFRPTDGGVDSVHLAHWPTPGAAASDPALAAAVSLTRRLVELGRAARAQSGVRTRQPLPTALVAADGWPDLPADLRAQVSEELNVVSVGALGDHVGADLVQVSVKANFRSLGRRFATATPAVAAAVVASPPGALVEQLRTHGSAQVRVGEEVVEVTAEDVVVTETPAEGWSVATADGETVALDLTVTPALARAGLAREVVRAVQEARKGDGLDISDRIALWWVGEGELAAALAEHTDAVAAEVLAVQVSVGEPPVGVALDGSHESAELGLRFWLARTPG